MEVYRTLYDNEMAPVWARPQAMFHEEVEPGRKRFTEVGRIRAVVPEDEHVVLAFGYDAWGAERPLKEFVASYASDRNHLRGTRYLIELPDGEPVANVNTLRFARSLVGLASLSVNPAYRRQGYGSTLVRAVMELLRSEDSAMRFMLFSEVNPAIYERLGFKRAPDEVQCHLPSVAMITGEEAVTTRDLSFFREYF
jgi:GNAT superfamily N-acetyltransferase